MATSKPRCALEPIRKRRCGFASQTQVKRGVRVVDWERVKVRSTRARVRSYAAEV
jgi:hypothetical protein